MWQRQAGGLIEAYRWPLLGSVAALIAVVVVVALVLAFCGDEGEAPAGATTPTATRTARPSAGTPAPRTATAVAARTATAVAARTATAVASRTPGIPAPTRTSAPGEPSTAVPPLATDTPSVPGPPETVGPGPPPEATPTPGAPGPTSPPGTRTPRPPAATSTPRPTSTPSRTPTPVVLPDLVITDLGVDNDRIWLVIGNQGQGRISDGSEVDIAVRAGIVHSVQLADDLPPGGGYPVLLEDEVVYQRELVLATVDPDSRIAEEDESNNSLSRWLEPDVPLDVAVQGISAVGTRLGVIVLNNCEAPLRGVRVRISVFPAGSQQGALSISEHELNLQPSEPTTLVISDVGATPGLGFRVQMEVLNVVDANPANDTFEGVIS